MPVLALLILPVVVVLVAIVLLPFSLVQRYRVGTARRLARGWLAAINLVGLVLSSGLFVLASAVASAWVPHAFTFAVSGLAAGGLLGLGGLALTRWEATPHSFHYTPNRWLVLGLTLVVTARVFYGFWRSWRAWGAGLDDSSWAVEAGLAGSMAAGAVVLGYYLVYWSGVRRRLKWYRRTERAR